MNTLEDTWVVSYPTSSGWGEVSFKHIAKLKLFLFEKHYYIRPGYDKENYKIIKHTKYGKRWQYFEAYRRESHGNVWIELLPIEVIDDTERKDENKMDYDKMVVISEHDDTFDVITEEEYMEIDCAAPIISFETYKTLLIKTLHCYITSPMFKQRLIADSDSLQKVKTCLIELIIEFKYTFDYVYRTRLPYTMDKLYLDYIIHINKNVESFTRRVEEQYVLLTEHKHEGE